MSASNTTTATGLHPASEADDQRDPLLAVHQLRKRFGTLQVLNGVDLTVWPGETVVILGRSGSGKSTLLRCINALEDIHGGSVTLGGELIGFEWRRGKLRHLSDRAVARQRAQIGMVFQQFNLFPHMTALGNVIEAPVGVLRRDRKQTTQQAQSLLTRVGLADKANAYPRQLSGGQQQRVAIARALAMQPRLMLFDEPTSALDPELVGEVLATMRDLAVGGLTMCVVTHEIGFAREVADRVVFMHEGSIVEAGPARQVLDAPQHQATRDFLSKVLA